MFAYRTTRSGTRKTDARICDLPLKQRCDSNRIDLTGSPMKKNVKDSDGTFSSKATMKVSVQQRISKAVSLPSKTGRLRIAVKPAKNKSVYVTKLDLDSSEDEIKTFLTEVGGVDILDGLRIYKLNSRSRYFSAFKIFFRKLVVFRSL
ncbi:hypothetical protein ACFFRR_005306 [Megaselia abdita]